MKTKTCPHCQAPELTGETIRFACGNIKGGRRKPLCMEREIAWLRGRMERLVLAGDALYFESKHAPSMNAWRDAKGVKL